MTDIELLPRADLPVIWDAFKAQVEEFRETAETLIVTDVSQKDKMELACRTRLTLRKIRIAVEHKRVELGEGHLKEIQKVNGAAKAIREFIEPMEARLLIQESFAERAEEARIAQLKICRINEVDAINPKATWTPQALVEMPEDAYISYLARLRSEKAEIEAANRARIEAEKRLEEQRVEMELREAALRAEAEAARILAQQERDAEAWRVQQERVEADGRLAEARAEKEQALMAQRIEQAKAQAEAERLQKEWEAVRDADLAEQKRIRDEQFAKLEAELAQERAAKQAEADAARKLALAPDVEKLRSFSGRIQGLSAPVLTTDEAQACFRQVSDKFSEIVLILRAFCN